MARNNQHSSIVNFFETAGIDVATALLGIVSAKVKERVVATSTEATKPARKTRKIVRKPRAKKGVPATTAAAASAQMTLPGTEVPAAVE